MVINGSLRLERLQLSNRRSGSRARIGEMVFAARSTLPVMLAMEVNADRWDGEQFPGRRWRPR